MNKNVIESLNKYEQFMAHYTQIVCDGECTIYTEMCDVCLNYLKLCGKQLEEFIKE